MNESMDALLESSKKVYVKRLAESDLGAGTIEVGLQTLHGEQPLVIQFGASCGFLPSRCTLFTRDREVVWEKSFVYDLVRQRDAFILKSCKTTNRRNSLLGKDPKAWDIMFLGDVILTIDRYELIGNDDLQKRRMVPDPTWKVQDLTKPARGRAIAHMPPPRRLSFGGSMLLTVL